VRHILIIVISLLLFTFTLFGQSKVIGVLYQYKTTSGFIWKTFGKGKVQPKYEGEVSNGTPDGFGVLSYPFTDSKSVVGEWKVGKEWNTEHYKKDGKLIGKYENGKWILKWGVLCGTLEEGTMVWFEKCYDGVESKYVGYIENRKPNGQGTYIFHDGRKYVGGWKDGKEHGQGTFTFSDGRKYEGEFKDGKINGQGTYTWSNGNKYVGEFKDGKRHVHGTWTHHDGNKYVGEFKHGMFHGQGTYTSPDGTRYFGKYKDDNRWNGTIYDKDGIIYGRYVDGLYESD